MPKIRNIVIFGAIAVVLGVAFYVFMMPGEEEAGLVSTASTTPTTTDGSTSGTLGATSVSADDFLALLLSVRSIRLDSAILADVAFNSLRDSSVLITPEGNEGRPNPFAQFGNDIVSQGVSTTQEDAGVSVSNPFSNPVSTPAQDQPTI